MATIKEEAMTVKDDCQYVRALDANGNSIRISKEDLAKVLGELMQTNKILPFMMQGVIKDANQAEQSGYYQIYEPTSNFPDGIYYGVLLNFNANGYYLQVCCGSVNNSNNTAYIRLRDEKGNWRNWRQF